ncbi:helix-turn-helix domain-containing protein [Paenibacillus lignilyticus]|uniref:Helix-turn-helix domain-containing protein n=1 Tax=Paenibacillus lignilyticus TaxID=1172615 RepID=A0ABS5C904_9BACL|nr:helix-turn-helix domain-containing protein [Paenibacillus lignilyticus]MBP3962484.1 helix-turn-helix domain-containing protein [Paenibacillus lignilyticus]
MDDLFTYYTDAIMIIHENQGVRTIHTINNAFSTITGFTSEQLVGQDIATIQPDTANTLWGLISRLCATFSEHKNSAYAECNLTMQADKPIFAEVHIQQLEIINAVYYTVKLVDRSEHKWIEEMVLQQNVVSSVIYTSGGLMTSLRSYRNSIPYDRYKLSLKHNKEFVIEEDQARVHNFFNSLRESRQSGQITYTLQLFEDRYLTTSLIQPFYNADDSFKCYAILTLAMNSIHLSKFGQAIRKQTQVFKSDMRDADIDPAYKLRLLMVEKKLSVTQLAENTQISLTTISNIRNGKIKKPQRLTAHLIAAELGVEPGEIWGD